MTPLQRAAARLQGRAPRLARMIGWAIIYTVAPFYAVWALLSPQFRQRLLDRLSDR